jgi:hypothetical protein
MSDLGIRQEEARQILGDVVIECMQHDRQPWVQSLLIALRKLDKRLDSALVGAEQQEIARLKAELAEATRRIHSTDCAACGWEVEAYKQRAEVAEAVLAELQKSYDSILADWKENAASFWQG